MCATLLHDTAVRDPDGMAIAEPLGRDRHGRRTYRQITFRELDQDSDVIAGGLRAAGGAARACAWPCWSAPVSISLRSCSPCSKPGWSWS